MIKKRMMFKFNSREGRAELVQTTLVKISQLVTSLQTSHQQDVFALFVPMLSTSCSKLVDNL